MQPKKIRRSITKSVDLRVGVERVFDFLNDPENWPKWAIVNMKSAKPATASWTVPARVIPNGDGSTFLMTFFQPPVLDDRAFDAAAKEVDIELAKLKELLEREP